MRTGTLAPAGSLTLHRLSTPAQGLRGFLAYALPRPGLGHEVNAWRTRNLPRLLWQFLRLAVVGFAAKRAGLMVGYGRLTLRVWRGGQPVDLGIASYRLVTDAGVGYLVDSLQNIVEPELLKFHGFGTGTTNESAGDTALVTELTTEYATDNTRPTGTTTEGASGNIYRTVATLDPDSAVAITEHGVFNQAANSGGTLLDRSKFAAVNLAAAGDTLQATYELTFTSGG